MLKEGKEPLILPDSHLIYIAKQDKKWTRVCLVILISVLFFLMVILLILAYMSIKNHPIYDGYDGTDVSVAQYGCKGIKNSGGSITDLELSPDPITMPGNVSLSFSVALEKTFSPGSRVWIQVQHKVYVLFIPVWIKLFQAELDACNAMYDNCPDSFALYGIPCFCPISIGSYHHPMTWIGFLPDLIPQYSPRWKTGLYWVRVWVSDGPNKGHGYTPFACHEIYFHIHATK